MKKLIISISDRVFAILDLLDNPVYFASVLIFTCILWALKPYIVGVN